MPMSMKISFLDRLSCLFDGKQAVCGWRYGRKQLWVCEQMNCGLELHVSLVWLLLTPMDARTPLSCAELATTLVRWARNRTSDFASTRAPFSLLFLQERAKSFS